MIKESDYLLECLKTNIPMIFTEEDEQVHGATNTCFICQEHMSPNDKERDHCHFTGKYRGAAHFKCNLAFKHTKTIPVFFHNLEGYDWKVQKDETFLHPHQFRKVHFIQFGTFTVPG